MTPEGDKAEIITIINPVKQKEQQITVETVWLHSSFQQRERECQMEMEQPSLTPYCAHAHKRC